MLTNKICNYFCTNIAEAGGEGEKRAISLQSQAAKYPQSLQKSLSQCDKPYVFTILCTIFFPPLTEPQQVVIVLLKCQPTHSIVHKACL